MIKKVSDALLSMQRQSWEQGVAIQAFLELEEDEIVFALCKEAAYRAVPDGRLALVGASDGCTDPCSTGEGLIYTLSKTNDEEIKKAVKSLEVWALEKAPRNEKGIVYHLTNKPEFWADSMYMLPPYLAAAGYYTEAIKQLNGYWDILYDKDFKLLSHMWDDKEKKFIRKDFWGVGNGWASSALTRMIDLCPKSVERDELIYKAQELIFSLLNYLREDGKFHDIVNDPKSFAEVNLSQMVAYSIFRSVKSGWSLDGWLDKAQIMRQAAKNQIDRYGLVQGVCGAPTFDKLGVAPEGQAFYLLMESAAQKILIN